MAPLRTMIDLVFLACAVAIFVATAGCQDTGRAAAAGVTRVTIKGSNFFLEVAADDTVRVPGLGRRTHIDDDGGMVFVFPRPIILDFVMRDCLIPIDIIYTDPAGRVLTTYTMQAEPPRQPDEGKPGDLRNPRYESRLKKYSSRYPAQFAIELKAGTIQRIGVKEGDKLEFDVEGLKKIAR